MSLVIFLSLVVLLVILFLCRLGLSVRGFSHLGSLMVVRDAYGHECWRSVVAVCLMLGHVIGVLSSSRVVSASGHRSASGRPVEMVQFFWSVSGLIRFSICQCIWCCFVVVPGGQSVIVC